MRTFRDRLRHKHLKNLSTGSMTGFFPLLLMVFIGLWWDTHCTGYFISDEYNEASFVKVSQKVSAWIDEYRSEHGRLPDSLQIDGLTKSRWEENFYYNEGGYERVEFSYRHWEDAYKLVSSGGGSLFWSMPDSSGYVFRRWDADGDSVTTVRLSASAFAR